MVFAEKDSHSYADADDSVIILNANKHDTTCSICKRNQGLHNVSRRGKIPFKLQGFSFLSLQEVSKFHFLNVAKVQNLGGC